LICSKRRALLPENRAAFLGEACPEDAELRAEVMSLLAQDATLFLESAPALPIVAMSRFYGIPELFACRFEVEDLAR
jgi:hypothetical protein